MINNFIKFLIFFTYLILIFCTNSLLLISLLILVTLIVMKILRIKIIDFFKTIIFLFPFLLFTIIMNLVWDEIKIAILIFLRLILAYMTTYVFAKIVTVVQIMNFFEVLSKPLKIFKINNKKLALMVGIAISMIPILKDEIEQKIYSLKSKGYSFKLDSLSVILKPIFISILKRTGEMEKSLLVKGYEE